MVVGNLAVKTCAPRPEWGPLSRPQVHGAPHHLASVFESSRPRRGWDNLSKYLPSDASVVLPPHRTAKFVFRLSHENHGAPAKIRTCDLCLRRATVVPLANGS